MSRLFREESDVKQLIKLRSIYELLELITTAARTSRISSKASCWSIRSTRPTMEPVQISLAVVIVLVLVALAFDFMNGFHDAANAIRDDRVHPGVETPPGGRDGGIFQFRGGVRVPSQRATVAQQHKARARRQKRRAKRCGHTSDWYRLSAAVRAR